VRAFPEAHANARQGMNDTTTPFWQRKPLERMSATEWEALCDGCGLCCLQKLEDEDTGTIHYTDVACRLLDRKSCRCSDYANRHARVPDCVQLRPDNLAGIRWLPRTCAYRLLAEDKPLPPWHYLVCGDRGEVHRRGISRAGRMRSEDDIPFEDWQDRVIFRSR
jgi:uncharacterized cysteine cluster protein YcgN (CxxCxxCC family)